LLGVLYCFVTTILIISILFGDNRLLVMSTVTAETEMNEELTRVFNESDDPVLTAPEVAAELEITQQAAYRRLKRANDRGYVERKKTGSRSVVWWPTETS